MTSFIIKSQASRPIPEFWRKDRECAFCQIIRRAADAYRIYEDDYVIAFLDILPLRPGHTLIVPKIHCSRVSELPPEYAASVGKAISKISNALTKAIDNTALNVVCNQEYAQVVPHVHYHIIPAPRFSSLPIALGPRDLNQKPPPTTKDMHRYEHESRDDLDEDTAHALVERVKAHL
ncbi:HIT-like protein [Multifurca ochricompacta]|uniref:HIT-like protein n=1 Tax=Multifurca ochricompacta TaxID=376703 RepID=A0AAD4QQ39_9AGAM|nr:HIT-like protein [Multifurca ochricompacta]